MEFSTGQKRRPTVHRSAGTKSVLRRVAVAEAMESRTLLAAIPGLVAAYGFEEASGSTVFDLSGTGNAGSISGATRVAGGRFGRALSFNGTSDFVNVPDSDSLDLTMGKTLEAWVYPTRANGKQDVVIKQGSNVDVYNLYARSGSNGLPEANVLVGGANRTTLGSALPVNTWSHLAGTYDGTTLRLYVNGTQVSALGITGSITTSTGSLRIGGNSIWGEYFQGLIDEVRIYDRALTSTEIRTDMVTPLLTPDLTPPAISGVASTSVTATGASIVWMTDEPASSQVDFGITPSYGSTTPAAATPVASHLVALSGLARSITYHFHVRSTDSAGNPSVSGDLSFTTLPPPQPVSIFVSPTGDDANPGTKSAPFLTLQHARDYVRTISSNLPGDVTIYLRGGTYVLPATLNLDQQDSGSNGYSITWSAYPGETPVIDGGQTIGGWVSEGNGIYSAPTGGLQFLQFYVNGLPSTLARLPQSGSYNTMQWNTGSKTVTIDASDAAVLRAMSAAALSQVRITILGKGGNQATMRIASISGNTITPQEPERTLIFNQVYPPKENRPYFLDNALAFLDSPGEFYVDPVANRVYYKPRAGEDLATAQTVAPKLDQLLHVEGTIDSPVHDLQFDGLIFQNTTWILPLSTGFLGDQASFRYIGPLPKDPLYTGPNPGDELASYPSEGIEAGVHVAYAHNLSFARDKFQNMGASAVNFWIDVDDTSFIGNTINNVAASGITVDLNLEGNPADARKICVNDVIDDNYITNIGLNYFQSVGIVATYTDSAMIEHNEVGYVPGMGISVGWGWADKDNAAQNNIVRYNRIHDVERMLADGGGIYTLSRQPGTLIAENYIYNVVRTSLLGSFPIAGIYLDEGTNLVTVQNNVGVNVDDSMIHQNDNGPNVQLINNNGNSSSVIANSGVEAAYQPGSPLTTTGTSGNDTIRITRIAQGQVQVQVNSNTATTVNLATLSKWTIDGGGGSDTLIVTGLSGSDDITVTTGEVDLFDSVIPLYTNVEAVQFAGGGGTDSLVVQGATVTLLTDATFSNLDVTSGGKLDVRDRTLTLEYSGDSPLEHITGLIESGRDGGLWDGTGIVTSLGDAGHFTVGVADNAAVQTITIRYTLYGDANLDRTVDINDLTILATNLLQSGGGFGSGDFNLDGQVNAIDLGLLALNWQMSVEAASPMSEPASTPPIDPAPPEDVLSFNPTTDDFESDSQPRSAAAGQSRSPDRSALKDPDHADDGDCERRQHAAEGR